jgi:hypothetical protein
MSSSNLCIFHPTHAFHSEDQTKDNFPEDLIATNNFHSFYIANVFVIFTYKTYS